MPEVNLTEQQRAGFEAASDEWNLTEQRRRFDRTLDVLRDENAGVPWIEFGALSGGFAAMCADALGHPRDAMWCCDFAPGHLSQAAARGFATAVWDLENGVRPPALQPGTFRTVLFCEIVEHLVSPERALAPIIELLMPGGVFMLTTPNLASLANRIRLLRGQTPSLGSSPGLTIKAPGSLAALDHLRVCVADEWIYLLERSGLEVTRVTGCTSAPRDPGSSLRRRVSVAFNTLLERLPGHLWQNTLIVARKRG